MERGQRKLGRDRRRDGREEKEEEEEEKEEGDGKQNPNCKPCELLFPL